MFLIDKTIFRNRTLCRLLQDRQSNKATKEKDKATNHLKEKNFS